MKTPGQIAYEAMLPLTRAQLDKLVPSEPTGDPFLDGVWEAQSAQLRADWEAVAAAVLQHKETE